jgi:hypothetical protein
MYPHIETANTFSGINPFSSANLRKINSLIPIPCMEIGKAMAIDITGTIIKISKGKMGK